jgi:hypothetical protein
VSAVTLELAMTGTTMLCVYKNRTWHASGT